MNRKKHVKEAGFTLVEMMVVMAIMGLLIAAVAINVMPAQDRAMRQKAKGDIRTLEQALEMYRLDMMDYPSEDMGLEALVSLPVGALNEDRYREGGYVKFLPNDPWGRPYQYRYPGEYGTVDIFTYGSDGEEGGEKQAKDIVSWEP